MPNACLIRLWLLSTSRPSSSLTLRVDLGGGLSGGGGQVSGQQSLAFVVGVAAGVRALAANADLIRVSIGASVGGAVDNLCWGAGVEALGICRALRCYAIFVRIAIGLSVTRDNLAFPVLRAALVFALRVHAAIEGLALIVRRTSRYAAVRNTRLSSQAIRCCDKAFDAFPIGRAEGRICKCNRILSEHRRTIRCNGASSGRTMARTVVAGVSSGVTSAVGAL